MLKMLNIFQLIAIGGQIMSSIANLQIGGQSAPFKLNNSWYVIEKVSGPTTIL